MTATPKLPIAFGPLGVILGGMSLSITFASYLDRCQETSDGAENRTMEGKDRKTRGKEILEAMVGGSGVVRIVGVSVSLLFCLYMVYHLTTWW